MIDEASTDLREASAGAMLRAARERRGTHIAMLAASIKVPQRKLEALEADRYDELPDMTFTRALAQAVCRALKIDAAPVLARLPQGEAHGQRLAHVSTGLNAPFRDRPGHHEPGDGGLLKRPVFWATSLVLLAAAAVALLPEGFWRRAAPALAPAAVETTPPIEAQPVAAPAAPVVEPAPSQAETAGASVDTAAPLPAAQALSAATPPAAASLATLRASAPSWVEVRDASDRVLLSRTLAAGETVGLDAAPPLRVKIGNAPATTLTFRGSVIDLSGATDRDNVARLELN
jgi:cytoskeleton protein RodZ